MRKFTNGLLVLIVLAMVGCVSTGENAQVPVVDVGTGAGDVMDSSGSAPVYETDRRYDSSEPVETPRTNSAVVALLSSAEQQTQRGDYVNAAATLERAIRISPRDGQLYYQLAQVRYLQNNYHQSEQLCRKAISLAGGDSALVSNSRSLMAQAQRAAQSD